MKTKVADTCESSGSELPSLDRDVIWIASFDIGKKNFAFCVEEIDRSSLLSFKKKIPDPRYNPDGTPTPEMKKVLDAVCHNGKIVLFKNSDLTANCSSVYLDPETFHNMTDLLDSYSEYWDKCIAFVIEEQMSFRGKKNPMAVKLGQHCYSYFCFRYGRHKQIVEFPSYHKTQVLGAGKIAGKKNKKGNVRYKAMDKPARKRWSIAKAKEMLDARGESQVVLTAKGKKDDLADTWCQLQAFKFLVFVDQSERVF